MRALCALALLCLAACAAPGEFAVELGVGETAFEPIVGEPTLSLIAGPQGGHHVWISVRVDGASSERVDLSVDVAPVGAPPPPRREPIRVHLTRVSGQTELVGWPAEFVDPGCLVGERVTVRVRIVDEHGSVGSDERIIVVGAGTAPPPCR